MLKLLITMSYRNLPTKSFNMVDKDGKRIQTHKTKEAREYAFVGSSNPAAHIKSLVDPLLREKGYDPSILTVQIDPTPLRGRYPIPPVLHVNGGENHLVREKAYADLKSCFTLAMAEYAALRREIESET